MNGPAVHGVPNACDVAGLTAAAVALTCGTSDLMADNDARPARRFVGDTAATTSPRASTRAKRRSGPVICPGFKVLDPIQGELPRVHARHSGLNVAFEMSDAHRERCCCLLLAHEHTGRRAGSFWHGCHLLGTDGTRSLADGARGGRPGSVGTTEWSLGACRLARWTLPRGPLTHAISQSHAKEAPANEDLAACCRSASAQTVSKTQHRGFPVSSGRSRPCWAQALSGQPQIRRVGAREARRTGLEPRLSRRAPLDLDRSWAEAP